MTKNSLSTLELLEHILDELEYDSWWDFEEALGEYEIEFKIKHTTFSEGGRWSNIKTYVIQIGEQYFQIEEDVPATEIQEDANEFGINEIIEVVPREVKRIEYVAK